MREFLDQVRENYKPNRVSVVAAVRRKQAINRLVQLGIHTDLMANICAVQPLTLKKIAASATSGKNAPLIALDRTYAVLTHMEFSLGLPDMQIKQFIENEPTVVDDSDLNLDGHWYPGCDNYKRVPLFTHISEPSGLYAVEERLIQVFPDRYDYVLANTISSECA